MLWLSCVTYGVSGVSLNRWIQLQVYDMGEIPGAKRWVGNHNKLIKWNFMAYGTYCIDIVDCEMIVIYVKKCYTGDVNYNHYGYTVVMIISLIRIW